jgi:hypothetical protein
LAYITGIRFPQILPMIQGFDISKHVNRPTFRHICLGKLLALVYEHRTALETQKSRHHFTRNLTPFGLVRCKSGDRSTLVVIFEEQSVPAIVLDHESLPLVYNGLEVCHLPLPWCKPPLPSVINIDTNCVGQMLTKNSSKAVSLHFELKHHAQLLLIKANAFQDLGWLIHKWHLAN